MIMINVIFVSIILIQWVMILQNYLKVNICGAVNVKKAKSLSLETALMKDLKNLKKMLKNG